MAKKSGNDFQLESSADSQTVSKKPTKKVAAKKTTRSKSAVADSEILSYRHKQTRVNNPEVGMVTADTDPIEGKNKWAYDPHIDPALQFDSSRAQIEKLIDDALASDEQAQMLAALEQLKRMQLPYLNWAGKAEKTSFEVDTVSLHVHERIDPASILSAVRRVMKDEGKDAAYTGQMGLFSAPFENLPLRDAIDFYKHEKGWSNRLIAGDSLLVMNSLVQKESMAGQVQMIYIDPPYGIKYGSNFQPFVNKRDVKDRKDEDLTQEPEMIKAFRDTWELGIHSYLTYLRDRLLLAKELLHESGSVFVQISDMNLHRVRVLLDEVFGEGNFVSQIAYSTTTSTADALLGNEHDYLLWFAKSKKNLKYRQLWLDKSVGDVKSYKYKIKYDRSEYQTLSAQEKRGEVAVEKDWSIAQFSFAVSQDPGDEDERIYVYRNVKYDCGAGRHWKTRNPVGLDRLSKSGRLLGLASQLNYIRLIEDYPLTPLTNVWSDTGSAGYSSQDPKRYVVQTDTSVIQRCILMATDPSDLILDPTCGSGTTALVAEKLGRRWITCDTSRVSITLAKQRLMTASYDYYDLKYPSEGLRSGFIYKTVPHVTLKSIANNPDIDVIYEEAQPIIEKLLQGINNAIGQKLQEYDVPFDYPVEWPAAARKPFDELQAARQARQRKMDATIAANADQETLYDQPAISKDKLRITGPFSVEAVPFPVVLSLDEAEQTPDADSTVARSGESHRQHTWRDELLKTGIRGKGGQMLKFASLETQPEMRYIHCTGTLTESGDRVVVSFGPEHAALEQRQVEMAIREAGNLFPLPKMIVFCAFAFDPEAAKDIDNFKGITALKAQMNTDLLTDDLKKGRSSNQSFWLMGQPDVRVDKLNDGQYQVHVQGFDYFNTKTGELESGGKSKIAVWMLDTNYDERSLFPTQVYFPLSGKGEGWERLKKTIRAELDESKLQKYHGTVSLPFSAGNQGKIAIKIVDDRGIESLKVMRLD